jgi:protein-tyrosine-phosphatase
MSQRKPSVTAEITLMCDASYNEELHLGGYAGDINVKLSNGKTLDRTYQGIVADSPNSNHSEMMAIAAGSQSIRQILRESGATLGSLKVQTDSQVTRRQYRRYQNERQHDDKYSDALVAMDKHLSPLYKMTSKINIDYIKAHVEGPDATEEHVKHNIVDRNAVSTRWMAQNHVFTPNNSRSRFYGVVLPDNPYPSQAQDLKQLGYTHAKRGMIARVAFIGKSRGENPDHPFMQGVAKAAKEQGKSLDDLTRIQTTRPGGGMQDGVQGLDRVLLRHYFSQQKRRSHHLNLSSGGYQFAGTAMRVMYGPQYPKGINTSTLTGRVEPASQFVINTMVGSKNERPFSTNEWMEEFSQHVDMGFLPTLESALKHAGTPKEWKLDNPLREHEIIIDKVLSYNEQDFSPKQQAKVIMTLWDREGLSIPDGIEQKIAESLESLDAKDNDEAVPSIIMASLSEEFFDPSEKEEPKVEVVADNEPRETLRLR